ncbi:MAG: acetylglutamate kinase [Bacteroidota bacterium]
MEKVHVIKVGGAVIEDEEKLSVFLDSFAAIDELKILIHGGGRVATDIGKKLGIEPTLVEGRRVTDDETLDLVTMVYGGLVNKKLVARLQSIDQNGIGLTGADGSLIVSEKRPIKNGVDYGWVGDPKEVNVKIIADLLNAGLIPVIAPLTHDAKGHIFNTNADTMAGVMAKSLVSAYDVYLHMTFELDGVLKDVNDPDTLIQQIKREDFNKLKEEGVIHSGMIPKLENAFEAIDAGVKQVRICKYDQVNPKSDSGTRLS